MKKFIFLMMGLFALPLIHAQTIYNINASGFENTAELTPAQRSTDAYFEDALRARPFVLNQQLRNPEALQTGDQVVLQLFSEIIHQATLIRKSTDSNGVTAITLQLNSFQYAYAYLSVSSQGYLLTVHIPEENQSFSSRLAINSEAGFLFEIDAANPDISNCGVTESVGQPGMGDGSGPQGNTPQNESCITMPGITDPAIINLMIVYTPEANTWASTFAGGMVNLINNSMAQLNQVAVNNNLGITFDLVYSDQVSYTEVSAGTDLSNLATPNNGQMDIVHDWRVTYEADLVALLSYIDGDGIGGIARLLNTRYGNFQTGFSNTKVYAATSLTFAHELGHNMGAMHNLNQASSPGPTVWSDWPENTWSAGWRWQGSDTNYYADLMSYTSPGEYPDGNPTTRISYFSDPNHTHLGEPAGHPDLADNARTLKEVKHYVARYRQSAPYCRAGVTSPTAVSITQVIMGDINQSSSYSVYSDYSSLASCMQAGDTQSLTVSAPNGFSSTRLKVWVDWNDDKEFDAETELAYASTTGGTSFSGSITAPLGVAPGSKRVRMRLYDISSGTQNTTPCGTASFGEVEDYTINLEASVPCTEAGVPQNLTMESATNSTATLSWDALYGIDHYELRYRQTGAPDWITISPLWYPYHTITGLTFETEYEAQVRSVCDGTPGIYSSNLVFETAGYCASQGGQNWNITQVTFSDINNSSSAGNPTDTYTDFTNVVGTVSQLFTYDFSVTGTGLPDYNRSFRVWIDYNQNGQFDANELAFDQLTQAFSATAPITIPADALTGETRMRVSYKVSTAQGPCDTFGTGEVEDYTLNIQEFTPCETASVPENFELLALSDTQATLGWDVQSGAAFELRFRETGTPDWTEPAATFNNELVLESLSPATTYEAQVRSKCDENTYSEYSSLLVFETYNTPPAYCAAGATNTSFEKISNVTFNTISNNSTSTAGYEDFTHLSTTVEKGESYAFSASFTGQSYNTDQVLVWIDFNQNGDFTDPGEEVLITTQGTSPWLGTISIDSNALNGPTRMRVRLHDTADSPNFEPCGNSTYGQVEDYTVNIVPSGYVFQNGSWSPGNPVGMSTTADDIYIMNGTTALSGNLLANNLIISEGATLRTTHAITLNGDIDNEGLLLFSSNASSTGQLDTFTGSITGSGLVTLERYIPARRAFRLLSSGVTTTESIRANWQEGLNNTGTAFPGDNQAGTAGYGTHITGSSTGANGFDATPSGNPSLFLLDNVNQSWFPIDNTDVNVLTAGTPYRLLVRGDRSINVTSNSAVPTATTLRATGTLVTGTRTQTNFSPVAGHFNFFGNPYQAAVDMNAVLAASANLNTNQYYIWDPNINTRGGYVTVELSTEPSSGTNTAGSEANQYLQPGQAAFATTATNAAASITFQEAHKAVSEPLTQVFNTLSKIDLRLYESATYTGGGPVADGLGIRFSAGEDNGLTLKDALKLFNLDENLGVMNNGNILSIEHRANPVAGEILPLFTNQYRHTHYVFEARLTDVPATVEAFLKDNHLNTQTLLVHNQSTLHPFTVEAGNPSSTASDRFEIVFEEAALSVNDPAFGEDFVLFPNPSDGTFYIATKGLEGQKVTITITNVLGQQVLSAPLQPQANGLVEVNAPELTKGVYLVRLTQDNGEAFTTKWIKN